MLITATTATRYDTMMIAWSIIILLLSPVFCTEQKSACEIESTVNRFMTCVNKEFLPSDRLITTKEAWDRNHTVPPYSITPQPVQFATLSDGGQYPRNTDITLTCAINCFDDNQCPNIYWSFMNSSNITTTDNQFIVNETTLTILQFNDSQQGQYICHTNDSLYSISSYPMELRSPKFTHWSNEIYDTPNVVQDNQNVYLTVSPNDTVILECSMAGNYLRADVDWAPHPENHEQTVKLPNGNLLVKYFSETTPGSFLCTILESDLSNAHLIYNIQVDKNDLQGVPILIATPRSQVVAMGTNVTLYCLAHSNTTVYYHWYHGNGKLITMTIAPQVMIIDNITKSGSYVCVGSNQYGNVSATAEITVNSKPSPIISVQRSSSRSVIASNNIDVIVKESLNIQLILNCSVESTSNTESLQYRWMFRGSQVTTNGNQLIVAGPTVDDVIGSVQCFVTNTDLNLIGMAHIRIIKDKCNPPTDIESISGSDSDPFFSLTWSPPTAEQGYAYQVEVYAYNAKDYKSYIYSVNTHQTCITVNMKVEAYSVGRVLELRNEVRIKAISLTTGQTSDYVYIPNIEVKRAKLPNPLALTGTRHELMSINNGQFNMSLNFNNLSTSYADNYQYKNIFNQCDDDTIVFSYYIKYCCANKKMAECTWNNHEYQHTSPVTVEATCNSLCFWSVGIVLSDFGPSSWTKNYSFSTSNLLPVAGGIIRNITRSGQQGVQFRLTIELPPENMSCDPILLSVNCGRDSFLVDDDNYSVMDITLPNNSCWDSRTVYFTYNNSIGMSPTSNEVMLPGPTKDDIGGFQNIMYKSLDSNNIIINWTLADGMACLIMKNYITNIVISIGDHTDINNCSSSKWSYNETLHNRDSNNITITISNNTVLTDDLCVMVQYTINSRDVPFYYVMKSAIKGLQPDPTSGPSTSSSNINQISTQIFLKYTLPSLVLVPILVLIAVFVPLLCYRYFKRKKPAHYEQNEEQVQKLLDPDGAADDDDMKLADTETIITKCEQLESLEAVKVERLQSYLEDLINVSQYEDTDSCNSNKKIEVHVVAEVSPLVEYECNENGKKIMRRDTCIPNPSLLKERDYEAVQNATNSVFQLITVSDDYTHSSAVTGWNRMSSSCSDYERHELQPLTHSTYHDLDTPLADLSSVECWSSLNPSSHDVSKACRNSTTHPIAPAVTSSANLAAKSEPRVSQYTAPLSPQSTVSPHPSHCTPQSRPLSLHPSVNSYDRTPALSTQFNNTHQSTCGRKHSQPLQNDSQPTLQYSRQLPNQTRRPLISSTTNQTGTDGYTMTGQTGITTSQTGITGVTTGQTGITPGQTGITGVATGQTGVSWPSIDHTSDGYIYCDESCPPSLQSPPRDGHSHPSSLRSPQSHDGHSHPSSLQSPSHDGHSRPPSLQSPPRDGHSHPSSLRSPQSHDGHSHPPSLQSPSRDGHSRPPSLRSLFHDGHPHPPSLQSPSRDGHSRPPSLRTLFHDGHSHPPSLQSPSYDGHSHPPSLQSPSRDGHSHPPSLQSPSRDGHSRPPSLRSPSLISSGIASPKSAGSMDSVFGEYTVGVVDSTHYINRHYSDATSGIVSPAINSPQINNSSVFSFPPLSIPNTSPNGYTTPTNGYYGNQQYRKVSFDQPHSTISNMSNSQLFSSRQLTSNTSLSHTSLANTSLANTSAKTPLVITSDYLPHTTNTVALLQQHNASTNTAAPLRRLSQPTAHTTTTDATNSVKPCAQYKSNSGYIVPSLLSTINSPSTIVPTQTANSQQSEETITIDTELLSPQPTALSCNGNLIESTASSFSDSYIDSYSIGSTTSSLEELHQSLSNKEQPVLYNDYLIDDNQN